ncbi:MAG: metal ABC transporter permease [Firmicutes bacterium]|nr:metal ABC transporter permease [Bacillota bacterium]
MNRILSFVFAPGFFSNEQVVNALWLGGVIAVVAGAVGVFTVLRGQSFAGHAMSDMGAAGAAGSLLAGGTAVTGFLSFSVIAGALVDLLGVRPRDRDVATGLVLTAVLGLGSLFLFFDTRVVGAPEMILFGSIFDSEPSLTPILSGLALLMLVLMLILYRPLVFSSLSAETAGARGVPVRLIGFIYMLLLAVSVGETALIVGSLLSTALLIGPASTALRLTSRIGRAIPLAALIGLLCTWLGILLAYDSYYWPPAGRGWPVSFFITGLVLALYLASRMWPQGAPTRALAD